VVFEIAVEKRKKARDKYASVGTRLWQNFVFRCRKNVQTTYVVLTFYTD